MASIYQIEEQYEKEDWKNRELQLWAICVILGRKKSRNMCQNAFFPCLQEITIHRGTEYGCIIS